MKSRPVFLRRGSEMSALERCCQRHPTQTDQDCDTANRTPPDASKLNAKSSPCPNGVSSLSTAPIPPLSAPLCQRIASDARRGQGHSHLKNRIVGPSQMARRPQKRTAAGRRSPAPLKKPDAEGHQRYAKRAFQPSRKPRAAKRTSSSICEKSI